MGHETSREREEVRHQFSINALDEFGIVTRTEQGRANFDLGKLDYEIVPIFTERLDSRVQFTVHVEERLWRVSSYVEERIGRFAMVK